MKILLFALLLSLGVDASVTRIMPLGDSITYDDSYADNNNPRPPSLRSGYRNYLWYKLQDAHYDVDFVGSRSAGSAIVPSFDPDNEGYPGWTSGDIANIIYNKLIANPPDIILLHIGSNDWSDSVGEINHILNEIDRYEQNYHHHIKVILARILNRPAYYTWTRDLNQNIQALADSRDSYGDDIVVVDMENGAGINYSTDFQDPTHPNNTGYAKMANLWFNTLSRFLTSASLPSTPPSFRVANIESDSLTLSWGNTTNETGFKVYQNGILIATLPANTTQYTIGNLDPISTYSYKIEAYNSVGSTNSQTINITTKDDYAWFRFQASVIKSHSSTLSWTTTSNETGFKVYQDSILIATLPGTTTEYTINNLERLSTYHYKIEAYNTIGDVYSQTIHITTKDDYAWLVPVYYNVLQ